MEWKNVAKPEINSFQFEQRSIRRNTERNLFIVSNFLLSLKIERLSVHKHQIRAEISTEK